MDWFNLGVGCTYGRSHDENRVLELFRAVWGKSFNRTDWPSVFKVTGVAIVRTYHKKMFPLARTQESRRFRLDSQQVSETNMHARIMKTYM